MTRARAPGGAQLCCSPSPGRVRSRSSTPAPPSAPPSARGSHVEAAIARRLFVGLAPGADRVTGRARRPHGPSGSMPRSPAPYRSVIIVADTADWQRRREHNGAVQSADRPGHAMLPPSGGSVPKPLRNAPAGVGARDPRDQRGHRASVPQAALSRGGPSKRAVAARAMASGVSKPAPPRGQPEDSALREFFGDQPRRLLARAGQIAPGSLDEARALAAPVDFDDTPWALRGPAPEFGPSLRRPVRSRRAACEWGRSCPTSAVRSAPQPLKTARRER